MDCASLRIKRPEHKPNNSPVSSAEMMMLNTKVKLVLRFQLNKQQTCTVYSGLAAVQIGTALLVKVSDFRYLRTA